MKIFILAAGLGTRLGDITKNIPKPMVDINGKPFLEFILKIYKKQGFKEFVFCIGYKHEIIEKYFKNGKKFGVKIKYSIGSKPLGTAGEIKNAKKYIDDTFIVVNGDTLINFELQKMIDFHKKNNATITIACSKSNSEGRSGGVTLQNNRITSFDEKTEKSFINAGVYVCNKQIIQILNKINKETISFEQDIFPLLCQSKKLFGYITNKKFIDIGIPKSLNKFKKNTEAYL